MPASVGAGAWRPGPARFQVRLDRRGAHMAAPQADTIIITVGTGRSRHDIASAISYSVRDSGAKRAVFLCSDKTHDETLPLILDNLGWAPDAAHCVVDVCTNPDDVQQLFLKWAKSWPQWVRDGESVVVDFTSGTKPMSAAAFAVAIARGATQVSYVTGARDETGRVLPDKPMKVQRITPNLVLARRQLQLADQYFSEGDYAAAAVQTEALKKKDAIAHKGLHLRAQCVHAVSRVYEAWMRFDWKQALSRLREGRRYCQDSVHLEDPEQLRRNEEVISAAEEGRKKALPNAAMCADLLNNIEFCLRRRRWDDALSRMYRTTEMLAQLRLSAKYNLESTSKIPLNELPERMKSKFCRRAANDSVKLGLKDAYQLLYERGDELGREFQCSYGAFDAAKPARPLKNLLQVRNSSLLAHGYQPIAESKARDLFQRVQALACVADPEIFNVWLPKTRPVTFQSL
ncbi:MAG: TIGR02710 family CRISPR-associated protein [Planctomycetota bacterium]|nr:MAG: TIGR02710 family CRISPR-associated protein [Planctomycetota bacterium]